MLSQYKTECPRCYTIYPMPQAKLSEPKARANCGKCGHTFFLNQHLIAPNQETPAQTTATTHNEPPSQFPETPINTDLNQPSKNTASSTQALGIADGMIFDDMNIESEDRSNIEFSDKDFSDFLGLNIAPAKIEAATAKDSGQHLQSDEAWLDELLIKEHTPSIQMAQKSDSTDELSKLIGEDLESLIPQAQIYEDPKIIMEKIQARLNSHQPTEEQLAKKAMIHSVGWGLACLLMVVLAISQYIFFNQKTIAKSPIQAALVAQLCSFCKIPSADPANFATSYALQDGQADFSTDLIGTLKNTASTSQLYPNLKIEVLGRRGLLGELVLSPKDYLAFEQSIIAVKTEGKFMLTLDIPKDEITSVTIEPFY